MIIDRNNIFQIMNKSNVKPDKDYGQNFLIEPQISKRIVDSLEINKDDFVLEIGPGLGSLSHFLLEISPHSTLVDIDLKMTSFLKVIYPKTKIINEDIRKVYIGDFTKIVGNLPYNITTELVSYLLLNAKSVSKMVLMCQSEAYNHFYDTCGKEYGPTSVLLHLLGKTKKLFLVKKGYFIPTPKCQSLVFLFERDNTLDYDIAIRTYELTKKLFLSRRKTIQNNLMSVLCNKEDVTCLLNELKISPNVRPEEIKPEIYKNMCLYLKRKETK